MYSLLLLSSLLHITTCTAYTVTPDDHYYPNTTCHHCHNLQHYLLNITKYFTSNTQLLFLPGLHHLHTDLIIQNVHNISFIGSTANGTTLDIVIQCKSSVGIVMINITNLIMRNMVISDCAADHSLMDITIPEELYVITIPGESYVILFNCFQVYIQHVTIVYAYEHGGLFTYNVLGKFILSDVKSEVLRIAYNDSSYTNLLTSSSKQNELNIHKFQFIPYINYASSKLSNLFDWLYGDPFNPFNIYSNNYRWMRNQQQDSSLCIHSIMNNVKQEHLTNHGIRFHLLQASFNVSVKLKNSNFEGLKQYGTILYFIINTCSDNIQNVIFIQGCQFENIFSYNIIFMSSPLQCGIGENMNEHRSIIKISNCKFIKNRSELNEFYIISIDEVGVFLYISECAFQNNDMPIIEVLSISQDSYLTIIKSHLLTSNGFLKRVIDLYNTKLILNGTIIFHGYEADNLVQTNSLIVFHNYVEFSNMKVEKLIHGIGSYNIHLLDNVSVNITNNHIKESIFSMVYEENVFYPPCFFQYFKTAHNLSAQEILIESNGLSTLVFDNATGNINCKWDQGSLYYGINPLDVYKKKFQTAYEHSPFNTGLLCYCPDETQPNCYTNYLNPLYPGQTLTLYLALNPNETNEDFVPATVKMHDKDFLHSVCTVSTLLEVEQLVEKHCTKLVYNIFSKNQQQCKLILYSTEYKYPTVYYINLLNCPAGFSFDVNAKKCTCDPKLKLEMLSIDNCNINDQTILRPANGWISATTHNNSYTYNISLHCPFHYCLPHSSHLNFSTPNSQCQFNRSGLLCGRCQQGLSTVFGSSHCQHCSNVYISLTIVIAIAGIVLVFLMFLLNLTVVDGTINAFVFYANIISMNSSILFPNLDRFTPAYTFISLANLDLGIQVCFYNGMDDYARMWLQLAFPFYLIFIATLIIITSRYSTTIQRLTARRALPVLATLFLLSYTKILRIVSSVLFFYSTITHLPSKHTTLVWSVDANVPLFGVRFTILFIVCLILFLILMLFNVTLFFNKILPKLSLFTNFKSLFASYQRGYKDKFYYWASLQLAMRAVFFGISILERNINLTISIILLSVMEGVQCTLKPFKNKALNYQELFFMLNALWLYAYALFNQNINMTVINVMVAMAALNFIVIIAYHIITCVRGKVITNKTWRNFSILTTWITDKCTSKQATN